MMHRSGPLRRAALALAALVLTLAVGPNVPPPASAWEWTDALGGGGGTTASLLRTDTLTAAEVQEMRVRDIKRRLARTHGYSADELGRMLDKKELIDALTEEEARDRRKELDGAKRAVLVRAVLVAIAAVVVVMGWPVWSHLWEVASVNWAVYTDRKRLEASRCIEYRSGLGMIGVLLMAILDLMQLWLSATVLLSWVMTSPYFFPMPSLPVRPAQFMGDKVASGPMGRYGINVAPMAVTWSIRFLQGRLESWTGKALSQAYQRQKREARSWESEDDKAARKAARKAAKRAAKEEAERHRQEEQAQEAQRRKEAADQATSQLFPKAPISHHAPPVGEPDAEITSSTQPINLDALMREEEDARRQFVADMQELDINDLD